MKLKTIVFGVIAAGLALSAPARAQDDFRQNFDVAAGGWVEIRNIIGQVDAEPASGSQVEVVAVKTGRRRDFDLVRVEVVEERDGITVCAVYPERRGRGRRSRNDPCDNSGNTEDTDVGVDFRIRVPEGVNLRVGTVVGDIEVRDLDGEVIGSSVSGDIYLSTAGVAEANTVSGSIEVHLGRADWDGDLSFRTVSGDIRVYVPEGIDTEVSFQSVTGDMESDFPITIRRRSGFMAGSLRGTIGGGGRELSLHTVSGDALLMIER